ncbi:MAG TPA: 16S rRNA (guanine(527)-N(7))-methyltransferase RsmG [Pyrinomonadaceae bacterium]|nr:16S rRNA (guanine(527)-N(7))-methyltransferase RsmG [Pyrinomonadaceae bacterium]
MSQTDEFVGALRERATRYSLRLDAPQISALREYYEQVMAWNARLHLVAPCPATEFATRHVLESLLALAHLSEGARVADVGSGAGLPIIPCLIVRADLRATLIESSPKKGVFLREALRRLNLQERAEVISQRFEKIAAPEADAVTCRALERLTEMFSKLVRWAPRGSTLLLFAGEGLGLEIEKAGLNYQAVHIPESERRFLYVVNRRQPEN